MTENEKNHIISYQQFLIVLGVLIILTLTSVAVTQIHLGALTVFIALLIASIKSAFVLGIFMHLKFENKMFAIMVVGVILLIAATIIITLFDYFFR